MLFLLRYSNRLRGEICWKLTALQAVGLDLTETKDKGDGTRTYASKALGLGYLN